MNKHLTFNHVNDIFNENVLLIQIASSFAQAVQTLNNPGIFTLFTLPGLHSYICKITSFNVWLETY